MANFLSMLADAGAAGIRGYGVDRQNLAERIRQQKMDERQQKQDAVVAALQPLHQRLLQAQVNNAENPPETFGDFETILQDGVPTVVQRSNRGGAKVVGPAVTKPQAPTFGTQEYTKAKADEARAVAQATEPFKQKPDATPKPPKAPSEGQEKAFVFYNLMKTAAPQLDAALKTGKVRPDMITLALRAGPLDFAVNRALNAEEQQYLRAARDFTAGVLRKESGQAVKNDEILNTMQRMIDLGGEKPETAALKKQARDQYMQTMEQGATPANLYYSAVKQNGLPTMTQGEDVAGEAGTYGKPPLQSRIQQLKSSGVSKSQARVILLKEGYQVP